MSCLYVCLCVRVFVRVSEIKAIDFRLTLQKFLIQIHFVFSNVILLLDEKRYMGELLQSVLNNELRWNTCSAGLPVGNLCGQEGSFPSWMAATLITQELPIKVAVGEQRRSPAQCSFPCGTEAPGMLSKCFLCSVSLKTAKLGRMCGIKLTS